MTVSLKRIRTLIGRGSYAPKNLGDKIEFLFNVKNSIYKAEAGRAPFTWFQSKDLKKAPNISSWVMYMMNFGSFVASLLSIE